MWNVQNPPFQLPICPPILFFTILFLAIIVAFTTQKTDRKGKIHCYSMIAGIDTHSSATRISSADHEKLTVMIATPPPLFLTYFVISLVSESMEIY